MLGSGLRSVTCSFDVDADAVPPLLLITCFLTISVGAMSLLVSVQVFVCPTASVTTPLVLQSSLKPSKDRQSVVQDKSTGHVAARGHYDAHVPDPSCRE